MNEMILSELCKTLSSGETAALATIIETKGSTPRKAGTSMLIRRDGRVFGTIGGGCSEADVRMRALQSFDDGKPCVVEVRMLNDIAAMEGMVCGGIMHVFIQVFVSAET